MHKHIMRLNTIFILKEAIMKYKAIVFDLDGTLLNTLDDLYLSVNYALEQFNLPLRTKEEVCSFVGNGVANLMERSIGENLGSVDFDACLNCFKKHYSVHSEDNTAPYDDVCALLATLKDKNVKCAIVSNKFDAAVKGLAEKYFPSLVDVALGESPAFNRKPAPDLVFCALEKLGVNKNDSLFVGDSEVDVQTALNAKIDFLGVLWGFRSKEVLSLAGATAFASLPQDILKFVE